MDSLLANYASSDDEDHPVPIKTEPKPENSPPKRNPIFNSLPPPKPSLFNSLPLPKSNPNPNPQFEIKPEPVEVSNPPKPSPSLFSKIPAAKKVVQFKPPKVEIPYSSVVNDNEEDEGEKERKRKRAKESLPASSKTSISSFLPAPKHSATLGSASGTGRRSMLETDTTPAAPTSTVNTTPLIEPGNDPVVDSSSVGHFVDQSNETYDYGYDNTNAGTSEAVEYTYSYGNEQQTEYADYNQGGYPEYGNNAQYENSYVTPLPEASNVFKMPGRKGRKDVATEIIEVKQDELMKNRPREDQVKSTGIAFGPAYQPASTKGKPTKLHKRKHQIGALYFDMRQKETELAERRSKGYLTKSQTQAKYGW